MSSLWMRYKGGRRNRSTGIGDNVVPDISGFTLKKHKFLRLMEEFSHVHKRHRFTSNLAILSAISLLYSIERRLRDGIMLDMSHAWLLSTNDFRPVMIPRITIRNLPYSYYNHFAQKDTLRRVGGLV
jgi:hypothetical protein